MIWKFILDDPISEIRMPKGAHPISTHKHLGQICVWAEVDSEAPKVIHRFNVMETGEPVPDGKFLGSVLLNKFVFHVYDDGEI